VPNSNEQNKQKETMKATLRNVACKMGDVWQYRFRINDFFTKPPFIPPSQGQNLERAGGIICSLPYMLFQK